LPSPVPQRELREKASEKTKNEKYKALCTQRGLTFVPVIFTTERGYGRAIPATALANAANKEGRKDLSKSREQPWPSG
jgi:hypothetical protein